jgi:prephenate dehydratase/chorismate mutase/prephenate dehydratase
MDELEGVRKRIGAIDEKILRLLNERMENALRTRNLKEAVVDEAREKEVLERVGRNSPALLGKEFSTKIFREVIGESRKLQGKELTIVGFQGEHGAFGEYAVNEFNADYVPLPCREFTDVFDGVGSGQLDLGIVPVENSIEGAVTQVNDLLVERDVQVVGEVRVPVRHCLLAVPGTDHREIRVVYSHPQALAQCRDFIARNKLGARPFYDTAGAARMVAKEGNKSGAAIAAKICAGIYNLEIIKENLEDNPLNSTRFLVIAKKGVRIGKEALPAPGNKCSIIFSTKHEAGALFSILELFADAKINLTRIESRPSRREVGNYAFLLDFMGSDSDAKVAEVLKNVEEKSAMYKFLGCYAEAGK